MESKLIKGLIEQYNFEVESGYIYYSMANYVEDKGMSGFAHFFNKQAEEEFEHAEKLRRFLFEIDVRPDLEGIDKPETEFGTFTETFKTALEHEKEVTKRIHDLVDLSVEENDHRVTSLLQWYVDEQVEEEDNFRDIVERLERINESWSGLYIYDAELGRR
ncbi:MAG: ferritin [Peptoniphilus harei]|uniref:ferritin n=1 Tax=Peptoniphilus harei TaxID=54005 RepID=UPI00258AAA35|nr:ferritin [Peptoniphilus harei]MDU2372946.1 ferritin [Peptoniphilus harei]MDU6744046.1 ferritin [Peptoniphilus harei]